MIPEGSCDSEDWSKGPENSALSEEYFNLKYIKMEKKLIVLFFTLLRFFYCIDQIN